MSVKEREAFLFFTFFYFLGGVAAKFGVDAEREREGERGSCRALSKLGVWWKRQVS